jgi:hypothetical protein
MNQDPRSEELRQTARFIEEEILDPLANLSDLSFVLVEGGAKDFPRPAPEDRAVERGAEILREDAQDAVAALYALAAARDNGFPDSPALLASLQPYIEAFRTAEGQTGSEENPDQTEGNSTA